MFKTYELGLSNAPDGMARVMISDVIILVGVCGFGLDFGLQFAYFLSVCVLWVSRIINIIITRGVNFSLKCTKTRLAAGLRLDPLGR